MHFVDILAGNEKCADKVSDECDNRKINQTKGNQMADPTKPLDPRIYNPDGSLKDLRGTMGGPRPGAGRPPGSVNGPQARFKAAARQYTDGALRELARIAGLMQRTDKDGKPLFKIVNGEEVPDMIPGSPSDTARIAAMTVLLERGWGKATQKLAGDDSEAPIRNENVQITRTIVGAGNHVEKPPAAGNEPEAAGEEEKRA
jgi:hypothetical protein